MRGASKLFFCVAISLGTTALFSCGRSGQTQEESRIVSVKNRKLKAGPIVMYGDSLAYGYGSEEKGSTGVSSLDSCMNKATGRQVINKGMVGATSNEGLSEVQQALSADPAIVVVSLGGNDVFWNLRNSDFPEEKTFSNLHKIFQLLTDSGALVVFLGLQPPMSGTERLPKISEIARQDGVLFVPESMKGFWRNGELMSDSIHPNDKGYGILCQRLLAAMASLN